MPGRAGFVVYRVWILAKKLWWSLYTWLYIYICCARVFILALYHLLFWEGCGGILPIFHPSIYLWWVCGGVFFYRFMVYHWGYTDFIDVNVFFVLFLVCFFKLLNFLVVQLQCMTHYYHTLYLMMSFRCSTLARFKVYLANWKWPFGSSICLKNRCLDLETGRSPLSLKSQFENQKK